ncbi:MAG: mechanosensitive ion channel family protein, partial [Gammaproteobacteria bacterium]
RFLNDLCDGLDEGRLNWEIRFRKYLGIADDSLMPGLIWIRLLVFIGLWGSFIIFTMNIWRLNDPWLTIISGYITEGFEIGSLRITPTLLAGGLLALVGLLGLTRYAKNHIIPHILHHTKLDHGAKEAITSLIGYAGVAIAILVALSITGVQMQNIAIIAGALSVGIGFGLQNIVNNFISGMILLFERPIRSGDWIVTGDTEGYVKSINIRSTQIETFDRADVIVPNSELITAKVTNWMLRDNFGRIKIPIGISYDADVNKAHKILLDIANKHPMIVKNNVRLTSPKVLFREFGDSALNFELRCFIYDVDQRLNVISELNFSILKKFRENNIEIPFPQRVITMNTTHTNEDNTSQ